MGRTKPFEYDETIFRHIEAKTDNELLDQCDMNSRGNQESPDISWDQYLLNEITYRYRELYKLYPHANWNQCYTVTTQTTEDNMRYQLQDLFEHVISSTNYEDEDEARELAKDYGGKVYDTQLKIYI